MAPRDPRDTGEELLVLQGEVQAHIEAMDKNVETITESIVTLRDEVRDARKIGEAAQASANIANQPKPTNWKLVVAIVGVIGVPGLAFWRDIDRSLAQMPTREEYREYQKKLDELRVDVNSWSRGMTETIKDVENNETRISHLELEIGRLWQRLTAGVATSRGK